MLGRETGLHEAIMGEGGGVVDSMIRCCGLMREGESIGCRGGGIVFLSEVWGQTFIVGYCGKARLRGVGFRKGRAGGGCPKIRNQ